MSDTPHTTVITSDEPVRVNVGGDSSGHWFRLWSSLVDHGIVGKMTLAECRTLIVLAKFASWDTWESWPSVAKIAQLAGLTTRPVEKALANLERLGVLTKVQSGGGRGRTAVWKLTEPGRPRPLETPSQKTGFVQTGFGEKPRPAVRINPVPRDGGTRLRELEQQQHADQAQPGTPDIPIAAADLMEALAESGIAEPTRSRLAILEGLTPHLVRSETTRAQEAGKGIGALVRNLEAAAEKAVRRRERAKVMAEQEAAKIHELQDQPPPLTGDDRQIALREAFDPVIR